MSNSSGRKQNALLKAAGWICHDRHWPQTWYAPDGPPGAWTLYDALNYVNGERAADARGAELARTLTDADLAAAIAAHPTLTSNGFDGDDEVRSRVVYRRLPPHLLPVLLDRVKLAHDYLIRLEPDRLIKRSPGSYRLKMLAEEWSGQAVSNGEVILAATIAGLAVEPYPSGPPNARIGVRYPVWLEGRRPSDSNGHAANCREAA